MRVAFKYVDDVLAGKIVTGELVRLACQRHIRDMELAKSRGLYFDLAAADRVLRFFPSILRHSKGEWARRPVELAPWQAFRLASVFGWKNRDTRLRRFRQAYNAVARKNGKALALDTPIPTPGGWRTMGDLRPGDEVLDELGRPTRISWVSPVMIGRPCYEVEFSTGERVVADAEHLWLTSARREDRDHGRRPGASSVKTTARIAATLDYLPRERNHRVGVAGPAMCPQRALPIDPYVLGAWLGDGSSSAPSITSADPEVLAHIEAAGEIVRKGAARYGYLIGSGTRGVSAIAEHSFGTRLRALDVYGAKRIPQSYLFASIEQRMALLQGLMDTDGHASKAGQCVFYSTNEQLAHDVAALIASLGFKPSTVEKTAQLHGRVIGRAWGVQFWAYRDRPVFRLTRKIERLKERPTSSTRANTRQIVAVRPVASVPVRCIAVEAASHLFLCSRGFIPTHNSTESAGLGLFMLGCDHEPGSEVFSYATKQEQAKIVWNEGKAMARKAPSLLKRYRLGVKRISFAREEAFWAPLSRDKDSMDGLNPHLAIADEVHAHKDRAAYDVIESAFGSRRQPLHWLITTRGANPMNICGELDDYAIKVLRGEVHDDRFFAFIACLDDGDAWDDEGAWIKANPNLGVSVKIDNLRDECTKARHMPGRQNEFRRKRCDLWTEAVERWIDYEAWAACSADVDDEELIGKPSWTTLDLSGSRDLTAMVTVYDLGDGRVAVRCRFWLPEDGLEEREKQDRVPYRLWVQQGWLETTAGPTVNLRVVADAFAAALSQPGAVAGGYDRYKIKEILTQLGELGLTHHVATVDQAGNVKVEPGKGVPIVPIGQGFRDMGAAVRELERLILERAFQHGGHPILWMCASNAAVQTDDAENRKFSKAKATGRIDGIVSSAMSVLLRKRVSADRPRSVYEQLAAKAQTAPEAEPQEPRSPFRRWFEVTGADDDDED